jgi:hypothetical protein
MLPTRLLRVVVVALAVVVVACGDVTRAKATFTNASSSFTAYALTGAPAVVPTATSFLSGPTHADSRFAFDVAFDIDTATGSPVIYPFRALASNLVLANRRIGLQRVSGTFESVLTAPDTGYDSLKVQVVAPGTVLVAEIEDLQTCFNSFGGQTLVGKLVVDSIDRPTKRLFVRTLIDPNCGYRSLQPDVIPTN